jgi:hypothetical protein
MVLRYHRIASFGLCPAVRTISELFVRNVAAVLVHAIVGLIARAGLHHLPDLAASAHMALLRILAAYASAVTAYMLADVVIVNVKSGLHILCFYS